MVVYDFIEENDESITYWYYPEDDRTKEHGVIVADKINERVRVSKKAERDGEYSWYGNHAINQIIERLNNDEDPRDGIVMWY